MSRNRIVLQWLRIVLGLLVFAFGVHLTIFANIGLAPWDCLGMGIARHTPLNYSRDRSAAEGENRIRNRDRRAADRELRPDVQRPQPV